MNYFQKILLYHVRNAARIDACSKRKRPMGGSDVHVTLSRARPLKFGGVWSRPVGFGARTQVC